MEKVTYAVLESGEKTIFFDWDEEQREDILYKKTEEHDETTICLLKDLIENNVTKVIKEQVNYILNK